MKCSVCGSGRNRNILCTKKGIRGNSGEWLVDPEFKCIRCWLNFIEKTELLKVDKYRYRSYDKKEVSAMRFCVYQLMKACPDFVEGYPCVEHSRELLMSWYDLCLNPNEAFP